MEREGEALASVGPGDGVSVCAAPHAVLRWLGELEGCDRSVCGLGVYGIGIFLPETILTMSSATTTLKEAAVRTRAMKNGKTDLIPRRGKPLYNQSLRFSNIGTHTRN